jgi:hypothetical protein
MITNLEAYGCLAEKVRDSVPPAGLDVAQTNQRGYSSAR